MQQICLAEFVDSGKINPQVEKVYSLNQAKEAFDYIEPQHPKCKVVTKINK